jgi:hypothetical protein
MQTELEKLDQFATYSCPTQIKAHAAANRPPSPLARILTYTKHEVNEPKFRVVRCFPALVGVLVIPNEVRDLGFRVWQ